MKLSKAIIYKFSWGYMLLYFWVNTLCVELRGPISWNSSTLATSWEQLTHWKRLWLLEGTGGRGRRRRGQQRMRWLDGITDSMDSWVWMNSWSWWWTGRPGVLRFMGSQRVGHDWGTELNWTGLIVVLYLISYKQQLKFPYFPKWSDHFTFLLTPFSKILTMYVLILDALLCAIDLFVHTYANIMFSCGLPWWLSGKESAWQYRRCRFDSWVRKIPWRRKWQSTPALLPGKSHGQRSLIGYSPWGRNESNTTEWLHFHFQHHVVNFAFPYQF